MSELATPGAARPHETFDSSRLGFLHHGGPAPTLAEPVCQLCTSVQFTEPAYGAWCEKLGEPAAYRRKQWEFVYILAALSRHGALAPGRRGLGFGCGREPLVAAMANAGCEIVATDLDAGDQASAGWIASDQHAARLEDLNPDGRCDEERFRRLVSFRTADMNAIPAELTGFDFVWSACAFEHLGSIARGLAFVRNAMRCLKPGGVAVHTTEFNLTSDFRTIEAHNLVVYRASDIRWLLRRLELDGDAPAALNLNPGDDALDRRVDLPPYAREDDPLLRLRLDRYVFTSIGIVAIRGATPT